MTCPPTHTPEMNISSCWQFCTWLMFIIYSYPKSGLCPAAQGKN